MAASRVGADGEVADEADLHPRRAGAGVGGGETFFRQPLGELVKRHFAGMRLRKGRDFGAVRVAYLRVPVLPMRLALRGMVTMQGLEARVFVEVCAALHPVVLKALGERRSALLQHP